MQTLNFLTLPDKRQLAYAEYGDPNGHPVLYFPEDVKLPIERNQMATAALSGNRIKFSYCRLDRAIALLNGQYAMGNIEVRIVRS